MNNEEAFYKDGLCFSCARCSHCCKDEPGIVLLSEPELKLLAEETKLSVEEFTMTYCRWVEREDGKEYLSLREKSNYDCIFWRGGGCVVYEARPVQCRTYPFWTHILKDENTWNKRAQECPGMNKGTLHDKEEIELQLNQYKNRDLICRRWRLQ